MTGEMHESEVTRDEWPLHFAISDALGGEVRPFDHYQGPYIAVGGDVRVGGGPYAYCPRISGVVRLWVMSDDGAGFSIWNEDTEIESQSYPYLYDDEFDAANAVAAAMETLAPVETA